MNKPIFKFLNHASIKVEYEGISIITDPWYISNAFGNWFQSPEPFSNDIYEIIDSDERIGFIVSHGHDDHLDDFFIKSHLLDFQFFCPKFPTPGLQNRLKNLGIENLETLEVEREFGPFKIKQFVNSDFTEYDSIVIIKTDKFAIVHANDNWHKYPNILINDINDYVKEFKKNEIYFLVQFGIADSFPNNYLGLNQISKSEIVNKRFSNYIESIKINKNKLSLNKIYLYANQANSNLDINESKMSNFEKGLEFIKKSKEENLIQLYPGDEVFKDKIKKSKNGIELFKFRLKSLENFININYLKFSKRENEDFLFTNLVTSKDQIDKSKINYVMGIQDWNRILNGELNLEAIIIGGIGVIHAPENKNISSHHHFISKLSYVIQNQIRKNGLSFFREFSK